MKKAAFILICFTALSVTNLKAQLTGLKNIPGNYATLALAIADLNAQGVGAGGVTLNLLAGNAQTAPAGGYVIGNTGSLLLTSASAANPVIITGNNNTITAAASPAAGSNTDAIFKIIGGDYITLQGFTMMENAANTTGGAVAVQQMTEFGVALFAVSATDGAQFNTIFNNTITLSSATAYQNAIGIFSTTASSATNTVQAATSAAGTNSNNHFYSNTISGVAFGLYFIGPPQTAAVLETGNDIGGAGPFFGNTITFGVSNTIGDLGFTSFLGTTAAGIYFRNVVGNTARFNTITSLSALTLATGGVFSSVVTNPVGVTYTSTANDNIITLTNNGAAAVTGVDFGSGLTGATFVAGNNTIILNKTAVAAAAGLMTGIKANYTSATNTCTSNSVTFNESEATGSFSGTGIGITMALTSTTINAISNNITFNQSSTGTGAFTGAITALDVSGVATTTNVFTNTILLNQSTAVATGMANGFIGIKATAAGALNITTGNVITVKQETTGAGTYGNGVVTYVSYNATHTTVNITGNTFNTTGSTIRSNGATDIVLGGSTTITGLTTIKNNIAVIDRVAALGNVGFFTQASTSPNDPADTISSNNITFTNLATSGSVNVINRLGGSTTAIRNVCNNIISVSGINTGAVNGIVNSYASTTLASGNVITVNCAAATVTGISGNTSAGSPGVVTIGANTFSLSSSSVAPVTMAAINGTTGTSYQVSNNVFAALNLTGIITSSPTVSGILLNVGTGNVISNNTITNISAGAATSTGNPAVDGIFLGAATSATIFKNKIYGITSGSTGTTGIVSGIRTTATTSATIYNNLIGGLTAPAAACADAIRGINIATAAGANTTRNIYYNTIYLNASSTGANFGTTGLYATVSATAGNSKLDLRNNIIINTSTAAGTGLTVAYRRSGNTLTNFAATSNNNLYYAGTPGAGNLIYYDGTTAAQALADYQAAVGATTDAAAKTENVAFLSTTGSTADFLHIDPAIFTKAESGAAAIATYTDDYDGDIRDVSTPDIGADEFTGLACGSVLAGVPVAGGAAICNTSAINPGPTDYLDNCKLIATITPSGTSPVSGSITSCVTVDSGATKLGTAYLYLARNYDITPAANPGTSTTTVKLYFLQSEFDNFNLKAYDSGYHKLPTGPTDLARIDSIVLRQLHGTATQRNPLTYTGSPEDFTTANGAAGSWNAGRNYWEITIPVTAFSGFFVTSSPVSVLPVTIEYLRGTKQGSNHLLDWKVNCFNTPSATLTIERSSTGRNYNGIYSINATTLRCRQPFSFTDATPLNGINYYRLKMTDANGKTNYSTTIALLNKSNGFNFIGMLPNPVTGTGAAILNTTSVKKGNLQLIVTDMIGQQVIKQTAAMVAGSNQITMDFSTLKAGIYLVKGRDEDGTVQLIRFVKQ